MLLWKSSPFCASVLLITMWGPLMWKLPKFRMFRIFLNINFWVTPPPPPPRSPTILGENINVKFACSGKLYCAPLKQDDAHTPMANQNSVRYSDSTSYFKKYSSSKCKQTVCLHYGLDFHFKAFEKTIEVFHDVLQRNVTTATDPHPQTNIWRFSWTKSICEASLNRTLRTARTLKCLKTHYKM
jgi:hypothetical protein